MSDKQIELYFKEAAQKHTFYEYDFNGCSIYFAALGANTLPIIFVHGSIGNQDAFFS